MSLNTILLLSLFLIIQFQHANSVTQQCITCQSVLNKEQCQSQFISGCYWGTALLSSTTSCRYTNNRILAKAHATISSSGSKATPNAQAENSYTTCSSRAQCQGQYARSADYCARASNNTCVVVDTNQNCTNYLTQNFCNVNVLCQWTPGSTTNGTCNNKKCSDYTNQTQCFYIVLSNNEYGNFNTSACKWSTSNSTCMDGVASDISMSNCESTLNERAFYTYDDSRQKCVECAPNSGSNIHKSIIIALLIAIAGV